MTCPVRPILSTLDAPNAFQTRFPILNTSQIFRLFRSELLDLAKCTWVSVCFAPSFRLSDTQHSHFLRAVLKVSPRTHVPQFLSGGWRARGGWWWCGGGGWSRCVLLKRRRVIVRYYWDDVLSKSRSFGHLAFSVFQCIASHRLSHRCSPFQASLCPLPLSLSLSLFLPFDTSYLLCFVHRQITTATTATPTTAYATVVPESAGPLSLSPTTIIASATTPAPASTAVMTAMMSPTTARMASGTQDFQGTLVIGGGDTSAPGTPITSSTPAAARALLCDHMQHGQDCDCAQVVNSGNSRSGNDGYSGRSGRRISMHARLISPIEPEVCDPNAADSDGSEVPTSGHGVLIESYCTAQGPKVHDLPSTGSFLCGRDHKLCHLFIQDIHCSRQQAEIIVDDKQGKLLITRVRAFFVVFYAYDEKNSLDRTPPRSTEASKASPSSATKPLNCLMAT